MVKVLNYIFTLSIVLTFAHCSTSNAVKGDINRNKSTVEEVSAELDSIAPPAEQMVEEELVFVDHAVEEEIEYETPPTPAPDPNKIVYVESDLRKEFPKKAHINIAKQLNIDIEDIYYYNNRSQVLAIYINTEKVLGEKELKGIQTKIYRILWDFSSSDITTFFKSNNQFYSILSSRKKWGELKTMIYDYKELKTGFTEIIDTIKADPEYPFNDKEVYGVFMKPAYLSFEEKSDLSRMSLYFIVKEDASNYLQYSASKNGVYMKNPIRLYLDEEGFFRNYQHNNTIKVCPYGDLLSHDNEISFKEKYNGFLLKVD